jgi:hypothetical protein
VSTNGEGYAVITFGAMPDSFKKVLTKVLAFEVVVLLLLGLLQYHYHS